MLEAIPIVGGGPAGAAAALALRKAGAPSVVYEKSSFPRHKVCGEFLTPEILPILEEIGVAGEFLARGPVRVTHAELHFRRYDRRFPLPEPAYGLSRYAFDDLLLRTAAERGAEIRRDRRTSLAGAAVLATGRSAAESRGRRTFGFKAHFAGTPNDAVELYFFSGGYCGLCPVEGGVTNVCGLASERLLSAHEFRVDPMMRGLRQLSDRLAPLQRITKWYVTGPLRFGRVPDAAGEHLPAGDAASFVDPFTGSGLLAAVQSGVWAAQAVVRALQGEPWPACCRWCRGLYGSFQHRQLATTMIIRRILQLGWAESLAGLIPGGLLFRLTRPRCN